MYPRCICRLLCGHLENQYRFYGGSKLRPDWDYYHHQNWKAAPCDRTTIGTCPPLDGAWEFKFPGCAFEARGRSGACCRCGSRPSTAGTCRGLSNLCKHACCITSKHYVGAFIPERRIPPVTRLLTCSAMVGEPCSCNSLTLLPLKLPSFLFMTVNVPTLAHSVNLRGFPAHLGGGHERRPPPTKAAREEGTFTQPPPPPS